MKRREFLRRLGVGSLAAMGFSRFALAQARPVKLAALLPLTGPFAFAGNAGREGFVDGVDYVNEVLGGIAGRKLELIVEDTGYDVAKGTAAFNRVLSRERPDELLFVYGDSTGLSKALAPEIAHHRLGYISIMAGISTSVLARRLDNRRVVRAMPNLAVAIGESSTALTALKEAREAEDLAFARALFATVGDVYEIPEHLFDAFTGMSASAPAYLAVVAEALADAGVKMGMPRALALRLAADALAATGELLKGRHPAQVKDEVASPGGTTIHGLHALEARAVRAAFYEAVEAATQRGHELGESE
jgi:pyrroline-5-carboxylate reductase